MSSESNRPEAPETTTEARAKKMAEAIEAGEYDVPEKTALRPDYAVGRPIKGAPKATTRPLAVRLNESDRQQLEDYVSRTGETMGAVVRAAISEYLERHPVG